jgi:hypothetical protein
MAPFAFPQDPPLPKLDGIRSRINFLAGFKPQIYDCCVNSCLCFVGPHQDLTECLYCHEPCLRANGKPRKKFTYIPIIPRLVAFAGNREMAEKQQYHTEHVHKPGITTDVFDGEHYRSLCKKHVEINDQQLPHKYFQILAMLRSEHHGMVLLHSNVVRKLPGRLSYSITTYHRSFDSCSNSFSHLASSPA